MDGLARQPDDRARHFVAIQNNSIAMKLFLLRHLQIQYLRLRRRGDTSMGGSVGGGDGWRLAESPTGLGWLVAINDMHWADGEAEYGEDWYTLYFMSDKC